MRANNTEFLLQSWLRLELQHTKGKDKSKGKALLKKPKVPKRFVPRAVRERQAGRRVTAEGLEHGES